MAKPFSLAALFRVRKLEEDRAAAELARTRGVASELENRTGVARSILAVSSVEAVSSETIRAIAAARSSSASMLAELHALGIAATTDVERAAGSHAEARAKALGLEKLEQKHQAESARADLHAEQVVLDDLTGRTSFLAGQAERS